MKTSLSTVALFLGLAVAAPASNATVYIGLQEAGVNGGALTTVSSDLSFATFAGGYGTFTVNSITGASPPSTPNTLDTVALDVSGRTPGELKVYVSATNASDVPGLLSSFTENVLPSGWQATLSTYIDTANGAFGLATQIGTATFAAIGTDIDSYLSGLTGPYSVTALYDITSTGVGSNLATIHVTPIPEPGSLGIFAVGLIGLYFARRRRWV